MYTLYYSKGACSLAVHVLLNELNLPHKIIDTSIKNGKNRDANFLKINPRGQIPVLVHGDLVIREGVAILLYLLSQHKNSLLPKEGTAKVHALEWLMFANATLHPAYSRIFFLLRNNSDNNAKDFLTIAYRNVEKLWQEVEENLAKHNFIAGDKITIADILLTVISGWKLPEEINFGKNCQKLFENVRNMESYKKSIDAEI